MPQTRQNGLPSSQPEECLQLAHLAYSADIKPEEILRIVTECPASTNGQGNRSGKDQAHHIPHHDSVDKNKSPRKPSTPRKASKSIRQQRNKRSQKIVLNRWKHLTQ